MEPRGVQPSDKQRLTQDNYLNIGILFLHKLNVATTRHNTVLLIWICL